MTQQWFRGEGGRVHHAVDVGRTSRQSVFVYSLCSRLWFPGRTIDWRATQPQPPERACKKCAKAAAPGLDWQKEAE